MEAIKNQIVDITRMTSGPEHSFFGYYDLMTWNRDARYHLCHKTGFADRMPVKEDAAQLGMIDCSNLNFIPLAKTTAWNFQQGSMLQWNPSSSDEEIIYNTRCDGKYKGVVMNIKSGQERFLEMPVANVDPTGKFGLSINFDRMFDFRPGYGYAGGKDIHSDDEAPADDGIYLIDMASGKSRLIISLESIRELLRKNNSQIQSGKLLINHINFNTNGTRFVFLARNFPTAGRTWGTAVLTANTDGSDMFLLSDYGYASHYHWRDSQNLLVHAKNAEGDQLYLLKDMSPSYEIIDRDYFLKDGHCSYSPDREWIIYDSYPDQESYRHLYLYNVSRRKGTTLAMLYAYPVPKVDIRCDLHPRWHPSGRAVTIDSIHENHRHLYHVDLEQVMKTRF